MERDVSILLVVLGLASLACGGLGDGKPLDDDKWYTLGTCDNYINSQEHLICSEHELEGKSFVESTKGGLEDARRDLRESCEQSGSDASFTSGEKSCPRQPSEREYIATCKGKLQSGERVEIFYYDLNMEERDESQNECHADGFEWFRYVDSEN